jgi:hypothetical protein
MEEEKNYIMPAALRDALLSYLSSRPWAEVNEGVAALQSLEEAKKK